MKYLEKLSPKIIAAVCGATLLAGCASGNPPLLVPTTAQQAVVSTNYVWQTNTVTVTNQAVVTTTNGVIETNYVTQTVTVTNQVAQVVTNTVTVTNGYTVSPTVQNVLSGAQTINSLSGPVNPYAPLAAGFLGLISAGLGYYASVKTKQAQAHLSTAATVITAIEGLAPAASAAAKAAVQAQALKMGTTSTVQQTVQAITANLPPSPAS